MVQLMLRLKEWTKTDADGVAECMIELGNVIYLQNTSN